MSQSESATLGVLGAGQLGRMLAMAGYPLGQKFVFVDPTEGSPAAVLAPQIVAAYDAPEALEALKACDVVTYEFESVPVGAVEELARHVPVFPPPNALHTAQDRLLEKTCFQSLGIPTPPFAAVNSREELEAALAEVGAPAVLKTRRLGYDGKGQFVIRDVSELDAAWAALGGVPLILEGFVKFERELSVLGARGRDGTTVFYPVVENQHRGGILRLSIAPAPNMTPEVVQKAQGYARRLLDHFEYVGVMALELFSMNGDLVANEIAPRVHNSGHWTIEGAHTSQFENHIRAVLGLPLGLADACGPSAMLNLIGALPDPAAVLRVTDAHLHLYGKEPRPGRKVGHITVMAPDHATLLARVNELSQIPGVVEA